MSLPEQLTWEGSVVTRPIKIAFLACTLLVAACSDSVTDPAVTRRMSRQTVTAPTKPAAEPDVSAALSGRRKGRYAMAAS